MRTNCHHCGHKFGLISHWYGCRKYCSRTCRDAYQLWLEQEVKKKKYLGWLFRPP